MSLKSWLTYTILLVFSAYVQTTVTDYNNSNGIDFAANQNDCKDCWKVGRRLFQAYNKIPK